MLLLRGVPQLLVHRLTRVLSSGKSQLSSTWVSPQNVHKNKNKIHNNMMKTLTTVTTCMANYDHDDLYSIASILINIDVGSRPLLIGVKINKLLILPVSTTYY